MDAGTYLDAVRRRMADNAYGVNTPMLPGLSEPALVGYRSEFRWSWFATKVNLFVAVKSARAVSRDDLSAFTSSALMYGKQRKGRFRGLQTGVGVIAAIVSSQVDDRARDVARNDLRQQFAAFAWPVVVDLSADEVLSHSGNPRIGRLYNGWMRQQIATLLPTPGSLHS